MPRFKNRNGEVIQFTAEEEAEWDSMKADWDSKADERKLNQIRIIRNQKLAETDFMANSDYPMEDKYKTWRQSLRDITSDYDASKYDELLNKEKDKTKDNFGQLTHTVWSKP